jgi:hypothetical protein
MFAFFPVAIGTPNKNWSSLPIFHILLEESGDQLTDTWVNHSLLSKCVSITRYKANFTWKKIKPIFKNLFYFEETESHFLISVDSGTVHMEYTDHEIVSSCTHVFFFKTFPLKNAKDFVYYPLTGLENIRNGTVLYNKEFYCISKDNELCLFYNSTEKIVKIYSMKNVPMVQISYTLVQGEGLIDQEFEYSFPLQDSIEDMQFSEDSRNVYILEKTESNIHIFSIYSLNDDCFIFCKMFNLEGSNSPTFEFKYFQNWIYLMDGNDIVKVLELKNEEMKIELRIMDIHFKFN